jgi:hypothetical protein
MGVIIQKTIGSGAPEVEDGLTLLRFDGIKQINHPDWAESAEQNKYHKEDTGDRLHFMTTVLDEETGAVRYKDDGDPLELETLTTVSFGEKSTAYGLLKGIFTKAELALFEDPEQTLDSDTLIGRPLQGIVAHNSKNWPFVESFMPATKAQAAIVAKAG